jgi:MFS family permease
MNKTKPKLWTKDFIIISASTFFISLIFFLLMTTLSVYAIEEFHASESMAGLTSSMFTIGTLVARFIFGKYIEIIGRRKLMLGGLFLFIFPALLYTVVNDLNVFMLVRFIHGALYGVAHTVMSIVVMDIVPKERRGEGIGFYALSFTLATAIGPFVGVMILQHLNAEMLFVITIIFSVISFIISLFAKIPAANIIETQLEEMKGFKLKEFFEIKAIPISIIAAILGFAYSGILSFFTAYSIEINLTAAASFFFIVSAAFTFISRPLAGRLFDVKGDKIVIYPSIIILTIGFVVLSQAHHGITLLLAGAFVGIAYGTVISCAQVIAIQESPPHHIGLATSTFLVFMNGAIGIGPYIQGYIIPITGYRGLYGILAIVVFASIFFYYFLHGKKKSYQVELSHEAYKN